MRAKDIAGKLDRQIIIQTARRQLDKARAPIRGDNYENSSPIWASFEHLKASEKVVGAEVAQQADAKFTIRHRTDIKQDSRIKFGDDVFEIIEIKKIGRSQYLELIARLRRVA